MVFGIEWRRGPPTFDLSFVFRRFGAMLKIMILGRLPDGPKDWAVGRQRVEKVPPGIRRRGVSGREGSPGTIKNRTL